jgi:hypothetical protein
MGGEKEGKGRMIYAKGGEYEGEWKKGKREGHGVMVYGDGGVYDGQWKDDIEVIPRYPSLSTTHPLFFRRVSVHTRAALYLLRVANGTDGKRAPIPADFPSKRRTVAESEEDEEELNEAAAAEQRKSAVQKRLARMRRRASSKSSQKSSRPSSNTSSTKSATIKGTPPAQTTTTTTTLSLSLSSAFLQCDVAHGCPSLFHRAVAK